MTFIIKTGEILVKKSYLDETIILKYVPCLTGKRCRKSWSYKNAIGIYAYVYCNIWLQNKMLRFHFEKNTMLSEGI